MLGANSEQKCAAVYHLKQAGSLLLSVLESSQEVLETKTRAAEH